MNAAEKAVMGKSLLLLTLVSSVLGIIIYSVFHSLLHNFVFGIALGLVWPQPKKELK